MSELKITTDLKKISKRFFDVVYELELEAKNAGIDSPVIIPVIKNNSNGLGFYKMFLLYKQLLNCYSPDKRIIAASYAEEFLRYASRDQRVRKLAWIWTPNKELLGVRGLELCCKNFQQLEFCIINHIPFHIVFNLGMNRGGFSPNKETVIEIKDYISSLGCEDTEFNITAHSPYSSKEKIVIFQEKVAKFLSLAEVNGLPAKFVHIANSAVTRRGNITMLYGGVRLGEALLLPQNERIEGERFGPYAPLKYSTHISDIMLVEAGETVGYETYSMREKSYVATIPVGYYNLGPIKNVIIEKHGSETLFPVLAQMHDISIIKLPNGNFNIGDEVILYGGDYSQTKALEESNWEGCVQRTYQYNKDLCKYIYI